MVFPGLTAVLVHLLFQHPGFFQAQAVAGGVKNALFCQYIASLWLGVSGVHFVYVISKFSVTKNISAASPGLLPGSAGEPEALATEKNRA